MGRIGVLAFDGKGWKGEQLSRQTHRQRLWEDDRRSHTPKEDSVIGVLLRNIVSLSMVDLIPILLALLTPLGFPVAQWFSVAPTNAGDVGSIPGPERSPGEGNSSPLQYSCLENPMDRGAWGLQSTGSQRVGHDSTTTI